MSIFGLASLHLAFCIMLHVLLCVLSLFEVLRWLKLMKFYGLHYVECFFCVFYACRDAGLCVLRLLEVVGGLKLMKFYVFEA